MSTIRMDFLVCSRCGDFWCQNHAPGPVGLQRKDAERQGWRITSREDVCDTCIGEDDSLGAATTTAPEATP